MLYAQATEHPRHAEITSPPPAPAAVVAPAPAPAPASGAPTASPAEANLLAANAPVAAQPFQVALPPGVAPEQGLQVKTIWAARSVSLLFPQITTIGGFRQ